MTAVRLPLVCGIAAWGMLAIGSPALAQVSPGGVPGSDRLRPTRVLAEGTLTAKARSSDLGAVLDREVPATLELYLGGLIDDWYAKSDQSGVVFILNVTTVEEASALLDPLPLGQAGMMTFRLTPIGPLRPLGRLLQRAPRVSALHTRGNPHATGTELSARARIAIVGPDH